MTDEAVSPLHRRMIVNRRSNFTGVNLACRMTTVDGDATASTELDLAVIAERSNCEG